MPKTAKSRDFYRGLGDSRLFSGVLRIDGYWYAVFNDVALVLILDATPDYLAGIRAGQS